MSHASPHAVPHIVAIARVVPCHRGELCIGGPVGLVLREGTQLAQWLTVVHIILNVAVAVASLIPVDVQSVGCHTSHHLWIGLDAVMSHLLLSVFYVILV